LIFATSCSALIRKRSEFILILALTSSASTRRRSASLASLAHFSRRTSALILASSFSDSTGRRSSSFVLIPVASFSASMRTRRPAQLLISSASLHLPLVGRFQIDSHLQCLAELSSLLFYRLLDPSSFNE
jgi:hypothetical protein